MGILLKPNLRLLNKPYFIEHPDGSSTKNIYAVDGILKQTIDQNGVQTHFSYDYQGRKTKEERIAVNGECLSVQQWIYNAFHLMKEIDSTGQTTQYTYNGAGQVDLCKKRNSRNKICL